MRTLALTFLVAAVGMLSAAAIAQATTAPRTVTATTAGVRHLSAGDRHGRALRARKSARIKARSSRRRRPRHEEPAPAPPPAPTAAPESEPAPAPAPEAEPTPTSTPGKPAPESEPAPAPKPVPAPLLEAGFENGLLGWSIGGVGDVVPTVVSDTVRSGSKSVKVILTGSQNRSELILGGNGGGGLDQMVKLPEGAEYWYGFSFYVKSMVYGKPGAHNLIMQLKGNDSGSPAFGLGLWDYVGDSGQYKSNPKGLWSHGSGMGGDRFLAPAAEQQWHDVAIHVKASRVGAGFYEVYLDGKLVDARTNTSTLPPEATSAYVKSGLYRNGSKLVGTSEIRLDDAKLGTGLAAVSG
jgi:Polysaccharide lyase